MNSRFITVGPCNLLPIRIDIVRPGSIGVPLRDWLTTKMDIFSPTAISILADSIPFGRIGVDRSVANAVKTAFGVIVVGRSEKTIVERGNIPAAIVAITTAARDLVVGVE